MSCILARRKTTNTDAELLATNREPLSDDWQIVSVRWLGYLPAFYSSCFFVLVAIHLEQAIAVMFFAQQHALALVFCLAGPSAAPLGHLFAQERLLVLKQDGTMAADSLFLRLSRLLRSGRSASLYLRVYRRTFRA